MKKCRKIVPIEPNPHCQFDKLPSLSDIMPLPANSIVNTNATHIFSPIFEERKMLSPAPILDNQTPGSIVVDDKIDCNDKGECLNAFKVFRPTLIYGNCSSRLLNLMEYEPPPLDIQHTISSLNRIVETLISNIPLIISKSQLANLVLKLRSHLKVDPFSTLPYEICCKIVNYFDVDSLLLARCINKRWRFLLDPMEERWRFHFIENSRFHHSLNFTSYVDALLMEKSLQYSWFHALPKRTDISCHNRAVITHLQILDNESMLASASDDGSVLIWQISPPKLLHSLLGHTGGVWCIHSIRNLLISGATDRTLRLWDTNTGATLGILKGHSSTVRCASLITSSGSEKVNLAVSGSRDCTLRIWDLESMTTRFLLEGHTSAVRCIAYSRSILVSGSYDGTARIWDFETGNCIHVLIGHMAKIYSVAILNSVVATGSMDSNIILWDIATGNCISVLEGMRGIVGHLSFLDSERLVSSSTDGSVRIWSTKSPWECLYRLRTDNASAVSYLQADQSIVIAGADRILRMWETKSGKHVRDLINDVDTIWRLAFNYKSCIVGCLKNGVTILSFLQFG